MQFTLTRKLQVLYILTLLIAGTVMLYFEGFRDMPVALEASQPDSLQYGAEIAADLFTIDGNIITGKGPAATLPYSYAILEMLGAKDAAEALREGMVYNYLMETKG